MLYSINNNNTLIIAISYSLWFIFILEFIWTTVIYTLIKTIICYLYIFLRALITSTRWQTVLTIIGCSAFGIIFFIKCIFIIWPTTWCFTGKVLRICIISYILFISEKLAFVCSCIKIDALIIWAIVYDEVLFFSYIWWLTLCNTLVSIILINNVSLALLTHLIIIVF